MSIRETFSNSVDLEVINEYHKGFCDADLKNPLARLPCCFSKGSVKRGFLDIYLATILKSVISKLQSL